MKLTITKKIMLMTVTGVVTSSIIILCISTILMGGLLNRTMHTKMLAMQSVVAKTQIQEEARLLHDINILSSIPEFVNTVYEQDAQKLKEFARFYLNQLGLDSVAVTDIDGIVLARGHSDRVGDDFSSRSSWIAARNGEVRPGILYDESAIIPYSIRCDAPIYKDGVMVGVISLALDTGSEEYVDNMYDITGMNLTLYNKNVLFMTSFKDAGGNRIIGTEFENAQILDAVLKKGENAIERTEIFGEPCIAAYWPIKGVDGEILGMWGITDSLANQNRETGNVLIIVVICSLGIMLLVAFAAGLLGGKITLPIRKAIDYAVDIAGGDLDVRLDIQSRDEVGTLAGALQTMVDALKLRMHEIDDTNKRYELQLTKLNLVVKASKIGLWDMEIANDVPDGPAYVFTWSDELRHMLGYKDENDFPDILSSWSDILHPEDSDRVFEAFDRHLFDITGKTPYDTEYRLLKKDGEYAFYRDIGATIRDENGSAMRVSGALMDITETKRLLLDLENETSILQTMFDSVSDLIFCKDTDYKYTRCNKSLLKHFCIKEEDIIGKDDKSGLKLPEEMAGEYRAMDSTVIKENRAYTYEEYVPSPDGSMRLFETNKVPLLQNGKVIGIMGIARDVTERKAMEDATKRANQAKSAFLANMSHEMRTPLNVVVGLTDLHMDTDDMPAAIKDVLKKINIAGNTLLNIVNDVLDISKIEAGKLELIPVQYNTASLLNDIITLNVIRIESKPITFNIEISEELPCDIYGDELHLSQVFNNLLSNAFKYTREGSVTMNVSCERDMDDEYIWMRIRVSDTGIGIKPDDLGRLFSDYNQVDTKANRMIEGTGLGLSITKKLVELMDGDISVESEYGKGTTFRVRVRQTFVSDKPLGREIVEKLQTFNYMDIKQHVSAKLVRGDMSYAKVLVVDDSQTNLDVASGMMKKYKIQVDCVTSGQAAISRIESGKPLYDAVFMDHMMPEMDGIEATRRIRALDSDYAKTVPIISLTANAIAGNEKMFLECGFQAFLSKPIDMIMLDSVLKKWVRDKTKEIPDVSASSAPEPIVDVQTIQIPGIDAKKALALYGNSMELYLSILHSFSTNTPAVIESLRNVTQENLPGYDINVHGLKGSCSSIGAEKVREKAARMEEAAKAGDLSGVLAENEDLIEYAHALVRDIKAWLLVQDSGSEKPRRSAPDPALMEKLRRHCEEFNMDGADEVMEQLESACYDDDNDNDLIGWLRKKVDTSGFVEVSQRVKEIYG